MNEVRKSRSWLIVWRFVNLAVFAVSLIASFEVVSRVHYWAWPLIFGPSVPIMEATGYSMGRGIVYTAVGAGAASFIPGFRRLPGRFFLAAGVLFFLLSFVDAYRLHRAVSPSQCSAAFADVLALKTGPCRVR